MSSEAEKEKKSGVTAQPGRLRPPLRPSSAGGRGVADVSELGLWCSYEDVVWEVVIGGTGVCIPATTGGVDEVQQPEVSG